MLTVQMDSAMHEESQQQLGIVKPLDSMLNMHDIQSMSGLKDKTFLMKNNNQQQYFQI